MDKLDSTNFTEQVENSKIPVVVDFYAEWCMPCKMLAPALDELATEFAGKVRIVKVDIMESPEIAADYKVGSVPTLIFYNNGSTSKIVGAIPKKRIKEEINKLI